MRSLFTVFGAMTTAAVLVASAYPDTVQWGRAHTDRHSLEFNLTGGRVVKFEGSVEETIRPYYEQIGQDTPGESFTLEELGLDGKKATFGISFRKKWKYITLGFSGSYFNPTADTTAVRDYYLGISDEIEYQGEKYDYMMIPEGRDFTADLDTAFCQLDFLITPMTFEPDPSFRFVPYIYLGIFGLVGYYDLDAGPPTGVVQYENPPRDYVVGGQTKSWAGVGVPAIGLGGEMTIGRPDSFRLILDGYYAFFEYDGSTDYLPVHIRHEKNLDLHYHNVQARILMAIPLSSKLDLVAGAVYQHNKVDGEATAIEKTEEEVEELREKYDKVFDFELAAFSGVIGLRF